MFFQPIETNMKMFYQIKQGMFLSLESCFKPTKTFQKKSREEAKAKRQAEKYCFIGFWFDFDLGLDRPAGTQHVNTNSKSTTIYPNTIGTNEILLPTNGGQRRTNETNLDVDASCWPSATTPRISGIKALARAFPNSTPHWSKLAMPQRTPWTKIRCSCRAIN